MNKKPGEAAGAPKPWEIRREAELKRSQPYRKDSFVHNQRRRCFGVDYSDRNSYLFTINLSKNVPDLSIIKPVRDANGALVPDVTITASGQAALQSLEVLSHVKGIEIVAKAIMPDHVHLMVYVHEKLPRHVGSYIQGFMAGCTSRWKKIMINEGRAFDQSFFEDDYNDRVCMHKGQWQIMKDYVNDNYRRRAMIMAHPDYFQKIRNIQLCGRRLSIYGNPYLLKSPERMVIRWSSRFTPEELEKREKALLDISRHHGVVKSPLINENERNLKDKCIAAGARLIHVIWQGFPDRYKPAKSEFELCQQGRLLIIALNPGVPGTEKLSRAMAMEMNALSELLCDYTTPPPTFLR